MTRLASKLRALRKEVNDALATRAQAYDPEDLRRVVAAMRSTVPLTPEEEHPGLADRPGPDAAPKPDGLPQKWHFLRYHPEHARLWESESRFTATEAGRRSGKSELHKRKVVIIALDPDIEISGRMLAVCCPTHEQAFDIYWEDLLEMIPERFIERALINRRRIKLVNGATILVVGMEKPQRAEGKPIDWLFMDEYADMKEEVWKNHLRASVSTPGREGKAYFYGTPDMAKGEHFMDLCDKARLPGSNHWDYFHWTSEGLVSDEELQEAREDLSYNEFAVEFLAKRMAMGDLAYSEFDERVHVVDWIHVWPEESLLLCLDFNHKPGIAVLCQEQSRFGYEELGIELPEEIGDENGSFTAVIGEVYIDSSTNTREVTRCLIDHPHVQANRAQMWVYGDPAGGASTAGQTEGSCWDLVEKELNHAERWWEMDVEKSAPTVVARVNAVNGRLRSASGRVKMVFARGENPGDGAYATARDVSRVVWKEGVKGQLEKKKDKKATHLSDALGYYIELAFRGNREAVVMPWVS